eukprot:TRINITY_DN96358_c0_g1_i1.p1 TRINITY_DN96358_c0_g1~~TRINITY_DN96358_c0_g1_i1.p1  ORF type:complete len:201 (+),score=12.72 TRINITY_DN96358_c0_g1_i1:34-636(+)
MGMNQNMHMNLRLERSVGIGARMSASPPLLSWADRSFDDEEHSHLVVKNTFLDIQGNALQYLGLTKRSLSSPALLGTSPRNLRQMSEGSETHSSESWLPNVLGAPKKKEYNKDQDASLTGTNSLTTASMSTTATSLGVSSQDVSIWIAHREGNCRPCNYFYFKADGCRNGNDCAFCHICTPEKVKARRREIKRQAAGYRS